MKVRFTNRSSVSRLISGLFVAPEGGAPEGGGGAPPAGSPPPAGGAPPAGAAPPAGGAPPVKAFAETLPEDIRGDASFKDIKDLDGLARSYVNAQKLVGADKASLVALPKDLNDEKAMGEIYNRLGRPESAEKYEIPKRADGKPYGEADLALQKQILPVLHKAGLTQRQIAAIVPAWNDIVGGAAQASQTASASEMEAAGKALKTEWGAAYEQNLALSQDALRHYAGELKLGDSLLGELDKTKLGNSPALAKLLSHLGSQLKEDGLIGKGAAGGTGGELSPAEAKQQIAAMEADKDKVAILRDKRHPKHAELLAERTRLYQFAHPPAELLA